MARSPSLPHASTRRSALRGLAVGAAIGAVMTLAGCAISRRPPPAVGQPRWSGRMALKVEDDPRLSFTAGFDLRGSAREGTLELVTPLGSTAALIEWSAAGARLQVAGEPPRQGTSLEALVRSATGIEVPVTILFDWLAGRPTTAAGWQVDLSERPQGRLLAKRQQPSAELRLLLDNP